MVIVTGGSGFIGSNIIRQLNLRGVKDILVVDNLKNGEKVFNLSDLDFCDYLDRDDFMNKIKIGYDFGDVDAVFHLGACSATNQWDGEYLMRVNYEYSKVLLYWCQSNGAQFLYASSASVYGLGKNGFREERLCELPINAYAFSKFQFDQHVRSLSGRLVHQVVGLRYFNVYGPREGHKGTMSSTPFKFNSEILVSGVCRLFSGIGDIMDGEQKRDFVYVEDAASVNLWFYDHQDRSGIFNVGTGRSQSFNDVAKAVVRWHRENLVSDARFEYIEFPEHLIKSYQNFTQADDSALRAIGCDINFRDIEEGVCNYLDWLNKEKLDIKRSIVSGEK